ncbi:MAG TPA: glutathione binding-like protein [Pseudothauera hydrothermalis]|jgi:GST-like protein|uniref:glutathione binding-like protein n=1 Tax=Pseudothauera hydrothermalis TaxID=2184083 RepID=UPI000C7B1896|nr:glutathione binding-like protein [Pseudothauera hydrothermalis]AUL98754.1 glutathione S-transferase [Rhodocyclaceae bacterium]HNQ76087.1 glutathione binding-like protein [Pseudothauera hydrothermalis]
MITLYTWATPNGQKISIALEELGLAYRVRTVDITRGEQFDPAFLEISPNNKIPAIVDHDGPGGAPLAMFESGAILIYLAEKSGRLLPNEPRARFETLQWLMMQMGSIGPMLGQAHHFRRFAPERIPYAIERYTREAERLYGVLDKRLADHEWLAGGQYSIADIATYPWLARHAWQGIELAAFPNVRRWFDTIAARPAVQRGMEIGR